MILTVTANVARDITYRIEGAIESGGSHRVQEVTERAGGKGLNVSSVLHGLGYETLALGCLAADGADQVRADLDARGIRHALIERPGRTRCTVNVHDTEAGATIFNEPGAHADAKDADQLVASLTEHLPRAQVVVISGSLPTGMPESVCARLVTRARLAGVPVIVDSSGAGLRAGLAAHPDLIKPNADELAELVGSHPGARQPGDVAATARKLARAGTSVVVSLGADGLLLAPSDGPTLCARLDRPLRGNPTGAGDALAAALATGIGRLPWVELLHRAVAWSAAAVLAPVAGDVRPEHVAELSPRIHLGDLPCPSSP